MMGAESQDVAGMCVLGLQGLPEDAEESDIYKLFEGVYGHMLAHA